LKRNPSTNDYLKNSSLLRKREDSISNQTPTPHHRALITTEQSQNGDHKSSANLIKVKQDINSNSILKNRVYKSKQAAEIPEALQ